MTIVVGKAVKQKRKIKEGVAWQDADGAFSGCPLVTLARYRLLRHSEAGDVLCRSREQVELQSGPAGIIRPSTSSLGHSPRHADNGLTRHGTARIAPACDTDVGVAGSRQSATVRSCGTAERLFC